MRLLSEIHQLSLPIDQVCLKYDEKGEKISFVESESIFDLGGKKASADKAWTISSEKKSRKTCHKSQKSFKMR